MAKKKADGPSKSQHIRDYLKEDPSASANQIVEALAQRGIKVSPGLASNVKYTSGPTAKPKKRAVGKKKAVRLAVGKKKAAPVSGKGLTADDLMEAKKLVAEVGGFDQARKALDALAALQN